MISCLYKYRIGDCKLSLQIPIQQQIEEKFLPFETSKNVDVNIKFTECEALPVVEGVDMVTEEDVMFSEYLINEEYIRTFHGTGTKTPYAVLERIGDDEWECQYLKAYEYHFQTIDNCFRHIALERIFVERQMMILHASFIQMNGEGILFTGKSGIGKSTQAELWREYEKAEILNGDRTILCKQKDVWYGYGSPYAGSSKIYKNESAKVKAIIALDQAMENEECIQLSPVKAFAMIYSGITLNTWNKIFMNQAMDLIQDLCMRVPVFYLKCKPDQSAIKLLKKALHEFEEVR